MRQEIWRCRQDRCARGREAFGVAPALAFFTHSVFDRHLDVGEVHHVDAVGAAKGNDRFNFDTFLLHGYQQERDALLFFAGIAGASQTKDPVGDVGESRPYLRAVDGVVATVLRQFGLGFEICQVRPCVGLGIALAPVDFSGHGYPVETVVAVLRCRSSLTPVPALKGQKADPKEFARRRFPSPRYSVELGSSQDRQIPLAIWVHPIRP